MIKASLQTMLETSYLECHEMDPMAPPNIDLLESERFQSYRLARWAKYEDGDLRPLTSMACSAYENYLYALRALNPAVERLPGLPDATMFDPYVWTVSESLRLTLRYAYAEKEWINIVLEHFDGDRLIARETVEAISPAAGKSPGLHRSLTLPGNHSGRRWVKFEIDGSYSETLFKPIPLTVGESSPFRPYLLSGAAFPRRAVPWMFVASKGCLVAAREAIKPVQPLADDVAWMERDVVEWPSEFLSFGDLSAEGDEEETPERLLSRLVKDPEFPILLIADPNPLSLGVAQEALLEIHRVVEKHGPVLAHLKAVRITWASQLAFNGLVDRDLQIAAGSLRLYFPRNYRLAPKLRAEIPWQDLCIIAGMSYQQIPDHSWQDSALTGLEYLSQIYSGDPEQAIRLIIDQVCDEHVLWNQLNSDYIYTTQYGEQCRSRQLDKRASNLLMERLDLSESKKIVAQHAAEKADLENRRSNLRNLLAAEGIDYANGVAQCAEILIWCLVSGISNFGGAFKPLADETEQLCEGVLKSRLQQGVPPDPAHWNEYFSSPPHRSAAARTQDLRSLLTTKRRPTVWPLLRDVLKYGPTNSRSGGVWAAADRQLSRFPKNLLDLLSETWQFRNDHYAHRGKDLLSSEDAEKGMLRWAKLNQLLRTLR